MATPKSSIKTLERVPPDSEQERRVLLEASGASATSRASVLSRRRGGVAGKWFNCTMALCGVPLLPLGASIIALGIVILNSNTTAYVVGGAAELVLGACILLWLTFQCIKCPRRELFTGDTVLFVALTVLFLVWCAVVCSLCAALVMSGLHYKGDERELAAIILSCVSLVLVFLFGGRVCCWAGCPAD